MLLYLKKYINEIGNSVLIIDDFSSNGCALDRLMSKYNWPEQQLKVVVML